VGGQEPSFDLQSSFMGARVLRAWREACGIGQLREGSVGCGARKVAAKWYITYVLHCTPTQLKGRAIDSLICVNFPLQPSTINVKRVRMASFGPRASQCFTSQRTTEPPNPTGRLVPPLSGTIAIAL
jgi:hypothetical protein